jgi:hypothetical protein
MSMSLEILKETTHTHYYVGHCQNSFDEEGQCVIPQLPYRDTTEFAQAEENYKPISKEHFNQAVNLPKGLKRLQSRSEHYHDEDNNSFVMHDQKTDFHHFFTKG